MLEILSSSPALLYEVTGFVACVGLLMTFALFANARRAADAPHFLPGKRAGAALAAPTFAPSLPTMTTSPARAVVRR